MDLLRKTALLVSFATLLTACGGEEKTPPVWETRLLPATPVEHIAASHDDMILDAFGDLVTLANVTTDGDPTTPAVDAHHQILLIKQATNGDLIWQSLLDYPGEVGSPYEVESDADGNLYLAGDGFVMKTDRYGQLLWQDTLDGLALSITVTDDRVYVPGNITRIYDLNGNLQLSVNNGDIYPWEVVVTDSGDIIQATWTAITRHDSYGNLIWSAPAPSDVTTKARVKLDSQENVYVSYLSNGGDSSGNTAAARLIKVSDTGSVQWNRYIPDNRRSSNYYKSGNVDLHITSDGDLLNVTSGTKGRQLTLLNSSTGQVIWEKVHNGEGRGDESHLDSSDNLYIVGSSNPQKYDADGNVLASGEMASTNTQNSLAVIGNRMYVGGVVYEDSIFKLYSAAFEN